jgi:hypothetical protein
MIPKQFEVVGVLATIKLSSGTEEMIIKKYRM